MNEIKCPKCGTTFQIDESYYDSIIKQIKTKEFNQELEKREKILLNEQKNAIKLQEITLEKEFNNKLQEKELEISKLTNKLENIEKDKQERIDSTKKDLETIYQEKYNELNLKVVDLENSLKLKEMENKNNLNELKSKLEIETKEYKIKEQNIKEVYENKLKSKDEIIDYYKDLKARQSTKMIGESLEKHCQEEFNKLRPLFKDAYFEKDNDIKTGSKGDFIFRDYHNNQEFVSIMFEMKNEDDKTATKHKNEDFFKELDKDRKEKNCEYAVLVSLLEIENDYYNTGITDVSYRYPKMYVIRPQFFIPIITLIRGAGMNALNYKLELEELKNQNIDISNFENNMNAFKEGFARNYRLASDKFKKAIEEIDKTIDHLQKTKEALLSSENNLRIANNKAEDLTIKKLCNNAKSVERMFEEVKND